MVMEKSAIVNAKPSENSLVAAEREVEREAEAEEEEPDNGAAAKSGAVVNEADSKPLLSQNRPKALRYRTNPVVHEPRSHHSN